MPLTGKIPKLDTQKLFDEMVVLESEVAGIIDGSLGQLRDVDKTDEYWDNKFEIKAEKFGQKNWMKWKNKFKKDGLLNGV